MLPVGCLTFNVQKYTFKVQKCNIKVQKYIFKVQKELSKYKGIRSKRKYLQSTKVCFQSTKVYLQSRKACCQRTKVYFQSTKVYLQSTKRAAGRAGLGWAWGLALVGCGGVLGADLAFCVWSTLYMSSLCLHGVFVFIFMCISDVYHGLEQNKAWHWRSFSWIERRKKSQKARLLGVVFD